jgi:S1-C subfamily serine protease
MKALFRLPTGGYASNDLMLSEAPPAWSRILAVPCRPYVRRATEKEDQMNLIRIPIAVLVLSCICAAQTPRDIARVAFKSVVLLEMNDGNGQPLSLGSGFFVSSGIIATNAHVLEGASSGTAKLIGDTHKLQILGTIALDVHGDLALLKVNSSAPSLPLGPNANPVVGDNVFVVGNPLGLEGTFSEGIISGLRILDSDSILQMTAPISPGSSGGPVMDFSGKVIGVAEATFSNGQNLNLAVPVAYLSKLIGTTSTQMPVTPLGRAEDNTSKRKSIVDGVGARAESGVIASNFEFWRGLNIPWGAFEFRLTNKLPEAIHNIQVRIIYRDFSGSIMDFEDFNYEPDIPPNLTKTVRKLVSEEGRDARNYYEGRYEDGSKIADYPPKSPSMVPKVELRVIGFQADDSQ